MSNSKILTKWSTCARNGTLNWISASARQVKSRRACMLNAGFWTHALGKNSGYYALHKTPSTHPKHSCEWQHRENKQQSQNWMSCLPPLAKQSSALAALPKVIERDGVQHRQDTPSISRIFHMRKKQRVGTFLVLESRLACLCKKGKLNNDHKENI